MVLATAAVLAGCSVEFGIGIESGGVEAPVSRKAPVSLPIPRDTKVPDKAGGLTRNPDTESAIPDVLAQLKGQLPSSAIALSSVTFAVYHQPDLSAPNGDFLLLRGTVTDPDTLLTAARLRPSQQGAPTEPDLGTGYRGVCTQSPNSGGYLVPMCVWVTTGAFGQLAPLLPRTATAPPPTTTQLVDMTRAMLPDLATS